MTRHGHSGSHVDAKIRPFWERINLFFLFPFQTEPLLFMLGLALCGLLVHVLIFIPRPLDYVAVSMGVALAASRYGFKVMEQGSQGQFRSSKFHRGNSPDLVNLPWKMFGICVVLGFVEGYVGHAVPKLAWLVNLLVSASLPAAAATLLLTCSFWQSLNPFFWLPLLGAMGWSYLVLCLFLFLLSVGATVAGPLLVAMVGPGMVFSVLILCMVYFGWVMCSLLGYVIYQHHEALGYLPQFNDADESGSKAERADAEKKRRLAEDEANYAELLAHGDVGTAREMAYEAQRLQPEDLIAQKRYHQILLLDDNAQRLCEHAQKYISLLLQRKQYRDAVDALLACRGHDASFWPDASSSLIEMGRYALRAHDPALCIKLINGFDKKYVGDTTIATAYELAARALLQSGAPMEKIRKIANALQQRYPGHVSTQEVQWLVR